MSVAIDDDRDHRDMSSRPHISKWVSLIYDVTAPIEWQLLGAVLATLDLYGCHCEPYLHADRDTLTGYNGVTAVWHPVVDSDKCYGFTFYRDGSGVVFSCVKDPTLQSVSSAPEVVEFLLQEMQQKTV